MASESAAKRIKTSPPLIGTHNGHFHADEALAVYLLRLLPAYTPSNLLRTRDPSLLSTCHTVVDVGGDYTPSANRFDHHQRTFATTFPSKSTKLSSAGLIYMHFGKAIIASKTNLDSSSEDVDLLWRKLYTDFIEPIDANDNGISVYDPDTTKALTKRFNETGTTLSSLVADLNSDFDIQDDAPPASLPTLHPDPTNNPQAAEDARFLSASTLMGTSFLRKLHQAHTSFLPARSLVLSAFAARKSIHPSGQIMRLPSPAPWKDHLYAAEETASPSLLPNEHVLYVLYPESAAAGAKWRVQCVGVRKDGFENRKSLPERWRGLREGELDQVIGEGVRAGSVFVHAGGFIGGHRSEEGAREMAVRALEM